MTLDGPCHQIDSHSFEPKSHGRGHSLTGITPQPRTRTKLPQRPRQDSRRRPRTDARIFTALELLQ